VRRASGAPDDDGHRLAGKKEVVEAGAELKEVRAPRLQAPHHPSEVINGMTVAFAGAKAVPAVRGILIDVETGRAVIV